MAPGGSGAPSGTAPASSPAADDGTITLAGVGDVIMGSWPDDLPPRGGKGFFDRVRTALAADLVMGNLETPLSADTGHTKCGWETPSPKPGNPSPSPVPASGCHQFSLPTSYAGHLKDAGFGVMNLANNHTFDMGQTGLTNTRRALDGVGIDYTGAPGQIAYRTVKGVKVAVIGFSIYGWTQSLNNMTGSANLVRKAAEKADIVVVQMQGGAEGADKSHVKKGHEIFLGEDRGDLIGFTHKMIDAGADVVFGHGPHIMRGMEFYKGRLIAYSLGNFCGYKVLRGTGYLGVGGILKVSLHPDGTWAGGTLVPTEMVSGGYPAVDKDKRALAFVRGLSADDFGDSAAQIDKIGKITPLAP
ncbi:CapA family protein [Luedemannella flava]